MTNENSDSVLVLECASCKADFQIKTSLPLLCPDCLPPAPVDQREAAQPGETEKIFFVMFGDQPIELGPNYPAKALIAVSYEGAVYWLAAHEKEVTASILADWPDLAAQLTKEDKEILSEFYFAPALEQAFSHQHAEEILRIAFDQHESFNWELIGKMSPLFFDAGMNATVAFMERYKSVFAHELDSGFLYAPGLAFLRGLMRVPGLLTEKWLQTWAKDLEKFGLLTEYLDELVMKQREQEGKGE